jgi:hypothetical protein
MFKDPCYTLLAQRPSAPATLERSIVRVRTHETATTRSLWQGASLLIAPRF